MARKAESLRLPLDKVKNVIRYIVRNPKKGDSLAILKEMNEDHALNLNDDEIMDVHSELIDEMLNEIAENGKLEEDKKADEEFEAYVNKMNGVTTYKEDEAEVLKSFVKNKVKGTYDLALYLTKRYSMITIGDKVRETYVYQNGYYTRAENKVILPEIQRILGDQITKNAKTETMHKIQDATSYARDIFENTPPIFIPVSNGVYNIETKELLEHSPIYRFRYQLPIEYSPSAECPKISAFFDQIFTTTQRQTIEEWIGYCFYRNYMYKKAVIIVGEGDTGKTTFLELITKLIGDQNKSGVSLHKITSDKFSSAQLYEKHINIFDELSADDVHDTANFKIATGGGSIMGEHKFGEQFSFKNFSKLTFACNKIPDVKDMNDEAYFNRWMIIHLEKTIEKKISNFLRTLTTDEELSGLFNLAITGLNRLLAQDGFSYKFSGIDTKLEMMRSSSSIASFAAEGIQKDPGNEMTKEELYKVYTDFCDSKNIAPETMAMLGRKLLFYAPYVSEGQAYGITKGKEGSYRVWRNVGARLTEEEIIAKEKHNNDLHNWIIDTNKTELP